MSNIETHYLIDYENVNEEGLTISNQLGSHDHIHLFFTKNASKISLESLKNLNNIDFQLHTVPAGKQSLDMHLIAYLGYLIGINASQKCKYIIVSKDNDYDKCISFLKELNSQSLTITRQPKINSVSKKNPTININKKSKLNTEIQRSISNAGYGKTVINKVASIVSKCYGSEHFSNDVHNKLKETYTNYNDIYKIIKPIIKKY